MLSKRNKAQKAAEAAKEARASFRDAIRESVNVVRILVGRKPIKILYKLEDNEQS